MEVDVGTGTKETGRRRGRCREQVKGRIKIGVTMSLILIFAVSWVSSNRLLDPWNTDNGSCVFRPLS